MAGIAMITIDASMVAIVMLSVVLDSAIHLYRPPSAPSARRPAVPVQPWLSAPGATAISESRHVNRCYREPVA